jgi:hypothetical protein
MAGNIYHIILTYKQITTLKQFKIEKKISIQKFRKRSCDIHGRSGRVTLVRTKLVPARPAMLGREAEAPTRRAARAQGVRRMEVAIVKDTQVKLYVSWLAINQRRE